MFVDDSTEEAGETSGAWDISSGFVSIAGKAGAGRRVVIEECSSWSMFLDELWVEPGVAFQREMPRWRAG